MRDKKVLWITQAAVFCAVTIMWQMLSAMFGNTLITGSIVNLILIMSVLLSGYRAGVTVALASPVFAKLFGIGPLWSIVPCILLGNIVIVTCWFLIYNRDMGNKYISGIAALVSGALLKFAALYISVVLIAIPLLNLPEAQSAAISAMFSVPQLITASIGGVLALIVTPLVKNGLRIS